ncbi:MAG: translocation/assembly module TamB domain-containing protein [Aquisalinus sp.]|nr:translocation/assembly module TamB domain-containing protein [Aquisalinus sp.]
MNLALKIFLGLMAFIVMLLVAGWLLLFQTSFGKNFLQQQAMDRAVGFARDLYDSDISLGALRGSLPGEIILRDFSASHEGEVWFQVEELKVEWAPLALVRRKVIVHNLTITNADLFAAPPSVEREEQEETQEARRPLLEMDLPWIELRNIEVNRFGISEALLGAQRDITLSGSISTANDTIRSDLTAGTLQETDDMRALIELTGDILSVDLSLAAEPGGIVSWALKEEKPLEFSLTGNGPAGDWTGDLSLESETFGNADAQMQIDLEAGNAFAVVGEYTPGALLSPAVAEAMGETLSLDLALTGEGEVYTLQLTDISGYFGTLTGSIRDIRIGQEQENVEIDLTLGLGESFAADNQISAVSGQNRLTGTVSYLENVLSADARLATPVATAILDDFVRDAAGTIQTVLQLSVQNSPVDQPLLNDLLQNGGSVSSRLTFADEQLGWRNLSLYTGNSREQARLRLTGEGSFALSDSRMQMKGSAFARKEVVALVTEAVSFSGPVTADFTVSGVSSALNLTLQSNYSNFAYQDRPFSSGKIGANLRNLPSRPAGNITITSDTNQYRAGFAIRSAETGMTFIENISANALGMTLAGNVQLNQGTGAIGANLQLEALEGAVLPTGQTLQGTADLDLRLQGGESARNRSLTASVSLADFSTSGISAESFALDAQGTLANADFTIVAENMRLPSEINFVTLESDGSLSLGEQGTVLALTGFRGQSRVEGDPGAIVLTSPTRLTSRDGNISLAETAIKWFGNTRLNVSGGLVDDEIVLAATGENIRLPSVTAPISIDLDVDTGAGQPGRLVLTGTARDQNDGEQQLRLESLWDGIALSTTATLTDDAGATAGRLVLQNPLRLIRSDGLSINYRDGPLEGRFTYNDTLVPLLSFLPVDTDFVDARLQADVNIGGTVSAPDVSGGISLAEGRFEERVTGAQMNDIKGQLDFAIGTSGSEGKFSLTAADATGAANTIRLAGDVLLAEQSDGALSKVEGQLVLDRAKLIDSAMLEAELTSTLDLTGSLTDLLLAGRIDIRRIRAAIPSMESRKSYTPVRVVRVDSDGNAVPVPQTVQQQASALALDIFIEAKDEIFISGRGLQSEWRGQLEVSGTSSAPTVGGTVETVSGRLDFAGRQFQISRGRLLFSPSGGLAPDLDIVAQSDVDTEQGDVQAIITVSGPAADPSIELSSSPELPQEDIMALVLFGKQPSQLSALESLRIATAVAQLSGNGVFGGTSAGLAQTFGLDALSFAQDAATGAGMVSVGKYVSDDIYVSATQGVGTGGSVSVTYDVNDKVSIETSVEQDGTQSVSANYKRDY